LYHKLLRSAESQSTGLNRYVVKSVTSPSSADYRLGLIGGVIVLDARDNDPNGCLSFELPPETRAFLCKRQA